MDRTDTAWNIAKSAITQITAWLETTQGGAFEFTEEQKRQMITQLHPSISNFGYAEYLKAQQEVKNEILIKLIRQLGPKQVHSVMSALSVTMEVNTSIEP